ncbi:MAG TPA: MBL fold metallo-hydrolase [Acidobacteriaceae bacterium]|jgi:phosphoribosyl 1,2-cyclic phosphodiesterase|nr:MBL fold metallo-hydrolase [Acidobacteriaceae bacterium]
MTVLASGSRGNATVISAGSTSVLVDAGLSCREILKRMAAAGEDPAELDAILITHEHLDHVAGLSVLARKLKIPVFFTEATHRAWVRMLTPQKRMTYAAWIERLERERSGAADIQAAEAGETGEVPESKKESATTLPALEFFAAGRSFRIGCLEIDPFTIPHDAADPCGFVFSARSESIRMAIATDLGYIPLNAKLALKNVDVLLLESNHDLEMLKDGPYPWSVKQRVLSRVGHLSNEATAEFLLRDYDGGAHTIVLGHLSEQNNLPELARLAAEQAIGKRMTLLGNRLLLAAQDVPLEPIRL